MVQKYLIHSVFIDCNPNIFIPLQYCKVPYISPLGYKPTSNIRPPNRSLIWSGLEDKPLGAHTRNKNNHARLFSEIISENIILDTVNTQISAAPKWAPHPNNHRSKAVAEKNERRTQKSAAAQIRIQETTIRTFYANPKTLPRVSKSKKMILYLRVARIRKKSSKHNTGKYKCRKAPHSNKRRRKAVAEKMSAAPK